jgi:AcrR family transcriptional regulator
MRRLADRLGASPMDLYRHVHKEDLLQAMIDQVTSVTLVPPHEVPPDPRERTVAFCHRLRGQLLEHPFLVPLVLARPSLRTNHPAAAGLIRSVLGAIGIDDSTVPTVFSALAAYIFGFVALETDLGTSDPGRQRQFGALLDAGDPAALDGRFEAGLRALLAGFRSRDP